MRTHVVVVRSMFSKMGGKHQKVFKAVLVKSHHNELRDFLTVFAGSWICWARPRQPSEPGWFPLTSLNLLCANWTWRARCECAPSWAASWQKLLRSARLQAHEEEHHFVSCCINESKLNQSGFLIPNPTSGLTLWHLIFHCPCRKRASTFPSGASTTAWRNEPAICTRTPPVCSVTSCTAICSRPTTPSLRRLPWSVHCLWISFSPFITFRKLSNLTFK